MVWDLRVLLPACIRSCSICTQENVDLYDHAYYHCAQIERDYWFRLRRIGREQIISHYIKMIHYNLDEMNEVFYFLGLN